MMVAMIILSELAILSSVALHESLSHTDEPASMPFLRLILKKYSRCEGETGHGLHPFHERYRPDPGRR
jgi:hypothetical protein